MKIFKAILIVAGAASAVAAIAAAVRSAYVKKQEEAEFEEQLFDYEKALEKAKAKYERHLQNIKESEDISGDSKKEEYTDYVKKYELGEEAKTSVWDSHEHEPIEKEQPGGVFYLPPFPARILDPEQVAKVLPDSYIGKKDRISESEFKYDGAYNDKVKGVWFHDDRVLAGWDGDLEESDDIEMARRCYTAVEADHSLKAIYIRDSTHGIDYEIEVSKISWADAWAKRIAGEVQEE